MTGRNETFALKARNQGSAIAGICDESCMSNTIEPDLFPLSSGKKYAASGLRSARIRSTVEPSVPALAAAFPASTGIDTLSNIRMHVLLFLGGIHQEDDLLWCQDRRMSGY